MLRPISLALCLCVLTVTAAALAQEPPQVKPGPEHELLKKMEGTWTASMKMADAPEALPAVATYKMDLGGLWLTSEFKMDTPVLKFQGRGLDTYDPKTKKYVGVWVDSMSTSPMQFEGTYDAATKTTTSTGTGVGPDGKPEKFKTVTKHTDNDHQTFQMFMVGADGKDNLAFTIEYTRKK
jgi:hypothetical protein